MLVASIVFESSVLEVVVVVAAAVNVTYVVTVIAPAVVSASEAKY